MTDEILLAALALYLFVPIAARVLKTWAPKNPLDVRTCEFCRFYDQSACKRYPPARVYIPGVRPESGPDAPPVADVTVWPVVRVDNWCGEFEAGTGRKS